jgi:hypothetical protein
MRNTLALALFAALAASIPAAADTAAPAQAAKKWFFTFCCG